MPNAGFTMTGDPALTNCDAHCLIAFQRGAASNGNQYWGLASEGPSSGSWALYDTMSFATPPAVIHYKTIIAARRFILAGRGTGSTSDSRRIFYSIGRVTPSVPPSFNPPEKLSNFQAVDSTSFSGAYGFPALAASSSGEVVMTYIGLNSSSQARVYALRKPYIFSATTNNWQARVEAPALPSSFTAVGTPAITFGYQGLYTIVVRAQRSGFADRLYRIFFNGSAFTDPQGSSTLWRQITVPTGWPAMPALEGNPAVEWGSTLSTHTVYYKSSSTFFFQASFGYDQFYETPKIITTGGGNTPYFSSSPSVNGSLPFEIGEHWVLGRDTSGELWFTTSVDDELGMEP
jgi:hypothetical protein